MQDVACNVALAGWYYFYNATGNGGANAVYISNYCGGSGIAGTMVANGSGVQKDTVRNIILAWVLTLPVCVLLGAALFGAGLFLVLHVLGVH